jgi:hypothetical protein
VHARGAGKHAPDGGARGFVFAHEAVARDEVALDHGVGLHTHYLVSDWLHWPYRLSSIGVFDHTPY